MFKHGWLLGTAALLAAVIGAGGLALAGAGGVARAAPVEAAAAAPDPIPDLLKSPPDVARGRALFAGTCGAYCHKMTDAPADAPFLFDCAWLHGGSDSEIFHTITHGVSGTRMVPFGGAIPDADIWRIVAYLKSASQCKR